VVSDFGEKSTTLFVQAMALLNFLQQQQSSNGGSSVVPSGAKDAVGSAMTMGFEQIKNALKGNVKGMKEEVVSIVKSELSGLRKNFQFILVGLRDAAVAELEEKSAEALDTLTAIADGAKATINNILDFDDSIDSGSEGLLSSVGGLVKDLVKGVAAKSQHWRVRDVSAFCLLRMVSGAAHEVHAAAFRKIIAKRKVRT